MTYWNDDVFRSGISFIVSFFLIIWINFCRMHNFVDRFYKHIYFCYSRYCLILLRTNDDSRKQQTRSKSRPTFTKEQKTSDENLYSLVDWQKGLYLWRSLRESGREERVGMGRENLDTNKQWTRELADVNKIADTQPLAAMATEGDK